MINLLDSEGLDHSVKVSKLPQRLYSCNDQYCEAEVSYPAEDLTWYPGCPCFESGWYCYNCIDGGCTCDPSIDREETLEEFLEEYE